MGAVGGSWSSHFAGREGMIRREDLMEGGSWASAYREEGED